MNTRDDAVLDIMTTILGSGKTSRLYRSLVYEKQIAQSVVAYQDGMEMAGLTGIEVTAKADVPLSDIEDGIASEIEKVLSSNVTGNELSGAINRYETDLVFRRSTALGKANALATYLTLTGDAENFNREFERYGAITPEEVRETASRYLKGPNVTLSIVPLGGFPRGGLPPRGSSPEGGNLAAGGEAE